MFLTIYLFIFIQLLIVSYLDIKTKKISNLLSIINIVFFIVLAIMFSDQYPIRLNTFIYSFVFLGVGFGLFLLKIMGGGDAKYLSTIFLIIPYQQHEKTLELLLFSTIIIGSFVFIRNIIENIEDINRALKEQRLEDIKRIFGKKFAFAPVIFIAWTWLGVEIYLL